MIQDALSKWIDINHNIDAVATHLAQLKEERAVLELKAIPELLSQLGTTDLTVGEYTIPIYKFIEVLSTGSSRELVKSIANRIAPSGETGSGADIENVAIANGFGGALTRSNDQPVF